MLAPRKAWKYSVPPSARRSRGNGFLRLMQDFFVEKQPWEAQAGAWAQAAAR